MLNILNIVYQQDNELLVDRTRVSQHCNNLQPWHYTNCFHDASKCADITGAMSVSCSCPGTKDFVGVGC